MVLRISEAKRLTYRENRQPPLYLVEGGNTAGQYSSRQMMHGSSGLFYVFVIAILFVCFGCILNIGLKIQTINYQKDLYHLEQMITIEQERSERLKLEISMLASPSRIIEIAQSDLGMEESGKYKLLKISGDNLKSNEKIYSYISRESGSTILKSYDSLLGTIYYVQDLILVVSESVLTFFIP